MNWQQAESRARDMFASVIQQARAHDPDPEHEGNPLQLTLNSCEVQFHEAMALVRAEIDKGQRLAAVLKEYAGRYDDRALALATGSHGSGLDPLEAIHALNEAGTLLAESGGVVYGLR